LILKVNVTRISCELPGGTRGDLLP
jgi:hypothetical protein